MTRRTALVSAVALFGIYIALSFVNDTRGFLGTDTGGKVATLRVMDTRGTFTPDVGYWAERWDSRGELHPLYYTGKIGSHWVNVTTLPALLVAKPLFAVAGYRGALAVPMLGGLGCALAAAALARRLGADDDRLAFWLTGLASPVSVYALDFWEHTVGLALMAWAVVLLVDLAERRRSLVHALGPGLLFGAAATMRTEALAFGAVATAVTCLWLVRRQLRVAVALGALVAVGTLVPLLANNALERAVLGATLRAERAAGTVATASDAGSNSRVREAAITTVGISGGDTASLVLGTLVVATIALAAWRRDARLLALTAAVYLVRAGDGFGFVPGLLVAAPAAAVGLTLGWRRGPPAGLVLAVALVALPVVWSVQFTGGAVPQWGGRYVLLTGLLIAVIGIVGLGELPQGFRVAAAGLAVAVTAFGVAWMHERTHDIASSAQRLAAISEPIRISRVAHLVREGGGVHDLRRWLTVVDDADLARAGKIADASGAARIAVVDFDGQQQPARIGAFIRQPRSTTVRYLKTVRLRVWVYARG